MSRDPETRGVRRQDDDRYDRSRADERGSRDQRDSRKRKNYDSHDYDSPKRPRARSRSPDRSDDRRYHDHSRREPPTGPKGRSNGYTGRDRNLERPLRSGGAQRAHAGNSYDKMEGVQHGKAESKPANPLARVSAAWIPDIDVAEDDDMLLEVQKVMGFAGFKSTNNKKVPGNDRNFAIKKEKETHYRQYMNRVGGFNRPLSPSRE
ncbi:hypothetical protein K461DRAFT_291176 [Myriangium duriaei CBS 260.36]|uniref:U4/U6.U5 small nuclear ribonucleoprotein 27kDa protein domain-containing protein n=1 Tax=Myriangium duriaei CBS 260.36 TaxID=1168546 RepID=A0A9P4MKG2_9PEZI|nr:hypothetical protein K461DRAFT_291176 [Myriangium duriaei CBS 260.36]